MSVTAVCFLFILKFNLLSALLPRDVRLIGVREKGKH